MINCGSCFSFLFFELIRLKTLENKITNLKIVIAKPEEIKKDNSSGLFTDTVSVMSSEVSLQFEGLTDEYILEFVSSIVNEFPGYIQIMSFSLNRSELIDKESLKKIAAGDFSGLVDAKLKFLWSDFKYKGAVLLGEEGA